MRNFEVISNFEEVILKKGRTEQDRTPNRTILFWNKYWNDEWFGIGRGYEPFGNCFNKNCYTTRDRSLLYNPDYIVNAIIFHGVGIPRKEFKAVKEFKMSQDLVKQNNSGIIPKIVLFMLVMF